MIFEFALEFVHKVRSLVNYLNNWALLALLIPVCHFP